MRSRILLCVVLLLTGCGAHKEPDTRQYTMPTDAMRPKLKAGQRFTARVVPPGGYQPRAGDVVVFHAPASWARGSGESVARVVAIGGTVIACCDVDGRVTADGVALHEPYIGDDAQLDAPASLGPCVPRRFGPVQVDPGHVFVMGDSRAISMDSRCLGTVPSDRITAVLEELQPDPRSV